MSNKMIRPIESSESVIPAVPSSRVVLQETTLLASVTTGILCKFATLIARIRPTFRAKNSPVILI
jgi:hypothetical protein